MSIRQCQLYRRSIHLAHLSLRGGVPVVNKDLMMAGQRPHVLVIGAGITGLLIAQGLKMNNIPCTIFETEPSASHYRPREWGLSIQWGLPLLRDCLPDELLDRLVSDAAVDGSYQPEDPGKLPAYEGHTGEHVKDIPLVFMYRVSRRRFRALCARGIDIQVLASTERIGLNLYGWRKKQYGKTLKNVEYDSNESLTAIFEDGTQTTGTLLIGTDGPKSAVRRHVFGVEKSNTTAVPYAAMNIHVQYGDAEKARFVRQLHPIMSMAIHPAGRWLFVAIQDAVDHNDPATWVFQVIMTWKRADGEPPLTMKSAKEFAAENFAEPFRSIFLWIPDDTKFNENPLSYWIPESWDTKNGRIALAGDAAHPMTFHRGQGMNHGIADAEKLIKLIKSASDGVLTWAEALTDYQKEMIVRAGDEVRLSLKNTEMLHDWELVKESPILRREACFVPAKFSAT